MHIAEKIIEGRRYYYVQHSYRSKDPKTGRSKVKTSSTYLGKADNILERLQQSRRPLEVAHKEFGFIAALVQVSRDIGLIELLQKRFDGERFGAADLSLIYRLKETSHSEKSLLVPQMVSGWKRLIEELKVWLEFGIVVKNSSMNQLAPS